MKKIIVFACALMIAAMHVQAQSNPSLASLVAKLDKASAPKDYEQLAGNFLALAQSEKNNWLPYYYAAFCNARTGWLYHEDGDRVEPYADKGEEQIKKAMSLLDTATKKKELSEIYCVMSMVNQARVFINPMTYGPKYGPTAFRYAQLAKEINSDNPRALYLEAWQKYSAPKMYGGDKKKAKEIAGVAKQKLDGEPDNGVDPHWGTKEVEALMH